MIQSKTVQARIDPETKAEAERVMRALGMTPTDAIRLLYRQICLRGGFPLELNVPNEKTAAVLSAADRGEDVESFETVEELFADLEDQRMATLTRT